MTVADVWYLFAAVWALVCTWAVVKGLRLFGLVLVVCVGLAGWGERAEAEVYPVCVGGAVVFGPSSNNGIVVRCTVHWTEKLAADLVGTDGIANCGTSTTGYTYGPSMLWMNSPSPWGMGCGRSAPAFATTYGAYVSGATWACGTSGTGQAFYGGGSGGAAGYQYRCSSNPRLVGIAGIAPGLFGLSSGGAAPAGYVDLVRPGVSWTISNASVWYLFAAFWALLCAALVMMGLRM